MLVGLEALPIPLMAGVVVVVLVDTVQRAVPVDQLTAKPEHRLLAAAAAVVLQGQMPIAQTTIGGLLAQAAG